MPSLPLPPPPTTTTTVNPSTLSFYRKALRLTRPSVLQKTHQAHLSSKWRYNIRDGISIHRHQQDPVIIQQLIQQGEKDLAIIQAFQHYWPSTDCLQEIFKPPTTSPRASSSLRNNHSIKPPVSES